MPESSEQKLDPRRLWIPASAAAGMLVLFYAAGSEAKSMRLAIETNARGIDLALNANRQATEEVRDLVKERPTKSDMQAAILEAVRPFDSSIAKLQAEMQLLKEQVHRSGDNDK